MGGRLVDNWQILQKMYFLPRKLRKKLDYSNPFQIALVQSILFISEWWFDRWFSKLSVYDKIRQIVCMKYESQLQNHFGPNVRITIRVVGKSENLEGRIVQWNFDLRKILGVTKNFLKSRFFLISNPGKALKVSNKA